MIATMTLRKGKGSLKHNKRAFVAKNVDRKRTPLNKNIIDEDIKQVYDNLFGKALEEYNARQTRSNRKINNYYEHISRSKQEKPFYELIVAIGDINNSDELNDRSVKILQEFVDEIKSKYSNNVKFFGAYIHMDEATPHLHLDYIPFCTNQKRGLKIRNSHNLAMKELGFTDYKEWHTELFEILEQISKRHNVYRNNLHSEKRPNIDINTYRAVAQKLDGAIDDILEDKTKEIKPSSDLSKGEKTLGGKGVKSEVYDSVVDTVNKLAKENATLTVEKQQLERQIDRQSEYLKEIENLDYRTENANLKSELAKSARIEREMQNAVLANNKLQREIVSLSNENDNLQTEVEWYKDFLYQLGLTDLFEKFKQWRDRILDSLHELAMKAIKQDYEEYCGYDNDYNDGIKMI